MSIKYKPTMTTTQDCTICLEEVFSGQCSVRIGCGHAFHQTCVSRWFEGAVRCPNCRHQYSDDEADEMYMDVCIDRLLFEESQPDDPAWQRQVHYILTSGMYVYKYWHELAHRTESELLSALSRVRHITRRGVNLVMSMIDGEDSDSDE